MMDFTSCVFFLASIIYSVTHGITIQQGAGCTRTGEYLVSRSNRCQYVHCAYRSSPRGGSSVVGILRQCPPGTAVPRALYSGSQALRVNHPMAICSERVYTPWYAADCNVNNKVMNLYPAHLHGNSYSMDHPHTVGHAYTVGHTHNVGHAHSVGRAHNEVIMTQPAKSHFYVPVRPRVVTTNVYKARPAPQYRAPTPKRLTISASGMLSDSPDHFTAQYKRALVYKPQKEIYTNTAPRYEYDIEPVAPSGGYKADYDSEGYYSNTDAEAELAREVRKLLPVEEAEIMTDAEASQMVQEMMAIGQYDEDA